MTANALSQRVKQKQSSDVILRKSFPSLLEWPGMLSRLQLTTRVYKLLKSRHIFASLDYQLSPCHEIGEVGPSNKDKSNILTQSLPPFWSGLGSPPPPWIFAKLGWVALSSVVRFCPFIWYRWYLHNISPMGEARTYNLYILSCPEQLNRWLCPSIRPLVWHH